MRSNLRAAIFVLAVALAGVIGYSGYILYPRFNLPFVDAAGLLLLSVGAGVASFFSPCSFPLLTSLLVREAGAPDGTGQQRVHLSRALTYASVLAVGASAFLLLGGLVIAFGGAALFRGVTFTSIPGRVIRAVVGTGLVLLGLAQAGVIHVSFHRLADVARPFLTQQAVVRRKTPVLGFALFGFAYVLAGFG